MTMYLVVTHYQKHFYVNKSFISQLETLPHFFPASTQMFSAETQPNEILIVVASFVFGTKQRCTCKLWPVLELELWLPPRFLTTRGADSSSVRSIHASEREMKGTKRVTFDGVCYFNVLCYSSAFWPVVGRQYTVVSGLKGIISSFPKWTLVTQTF